MTRTGMPLRLDATPEPPGPSWRPMPVCNSCDRLAPEVEDNDMGYCADCLAESERLTREYEETLGRR